MQFYPKFEVELEDIVNFHLLIFSTKGKYSDPTRFQFRKIKIDTPFSIFISNSIILFQYVVSKNCGCDKYVETKQKQRDNK